MLSESKTGWIGTISSFTIIGSVSAGLNSYRDAGVTSRNSWIVALGLPGMKLMRRKKSRLKVTVSSVPPLTTLNKILTKMTIVSQILRDKVRMILMEVMKILANRAFLGMRWKKRQRGKIVRR